MHILVTGAAGFIGSHLSEYLMELGHKVRCIDCLTDFYSKELKTLNLNQLKEKGAEFLFADLAEDDLESAVKDIDYVYHLAAQPGISTTNEFGTYVRNNITATYRLLEFVKQAPQIVGLVNISTSSVYGVDATGEESIEAKPASHYGVTKLAAEQLVLSYARNQGLPACSMRLFSVYGPRERPDKLYPRLIRSILEDNEFPFYEGSESHLRSYTYVGDVVQGLVAALDNFDQCIGEVINMGTDIAITTGEGVRIVENIIGKRAKKVIRAKRKGDQLRTHANIEKARRILGYDPKTTLREGLAKEVKWYKQHISGKINLWPDQ